MYLDVISFKILGDIYWSVQCFILTYSNKKINNTICSVLLTHLIVLQEVHYYIIILKVNSS